MLVFGAVYADARLDGVLFCRVRRDGVNATPRLTACIRQSRFYPQLHTVLLQGIAFAGFNVVDIHGLCAMLARPSADPMRSAAQCRRRGVRATLHAARPRCDRDDGAAAVGGSARRCSHIVKTGEK